MNFSVMTFNLRFNNPNDGANAWPNRSHQVISLIQRYNPYVLGTQEGLLPMLLELEAGLPDYAWIGEGRDGGDKGEYNALFYKSSELKLLEHGQFWLSEQPDRPGILSWGSACPRICVWAHFESKTDPNKRFKAFNTHLDHISGQAQEEGMKVVLRAMEEHYRAEPIPMFLMGDFNSNPDDPALRLLRKQGASAKPELIDGFEAAQTPPGRTWHDFRGGEQGEPIDYIFVSKEVNLHATTVIRDSEEGRYPSDHYPIAASVSL
ncbi:endonuclease/exonuclease/phosphatase family protein [Paenibacillus thermotolerans]|uniref:endonuclease/exonuclease/phosphatase family protein n=1 Tax=Paenibacillus thermotolerans TaxID=3027807 RepID=UPI002367F857|nr:MULTISPECIES: endonuclease/exonuclease/phosphatase family protein [unclassified Paenibacillus]